MAPSLSGDMDRADEYADYFTQTITPQVIIDAGSSADIIESTEPVSQRGIDSDEIAELVAMSRVFHLQAEDTQDVSAPGTLKGEVDLGINLSEGEFATQAGANNPTTEVNDPDQVGGNFQPENGDLFRYANYEEPGVLDSCFGSIGSGFDDAATGKGGGTGGAATFERFINFRQNFGSGPYVDRTDDLTFHIEISLDNFDNGKGTVQAIYVLYWDVEQMPEGRASFARP